MGTVIEIGKFIPCEICKKRQATLLCDMPLMRVKNMHMPNKKDSFKEYTVTCDKAICDKCAKDMGNGIHICKTCLEKFNK